MTKYHLLSCIAGCLFLINLDVDCAEDTARITIHAGQKIGTVHPWIYGQFLEHINYTADLGLHAEMLAERSFEMACKDMPDKMLVPGALRPGLDPAFPAFLWSATYQTDPLLYRNVPANLPPQDVSYRLMEGKPKQVEYGVVNAQPGVIGKGEHDKQVVNGQRYMRITIRKDQPRTEGIRQEFVPARKGEQLDGFVFLRGSKDADPVEVGLRKRGGGEVYAKTTISGFNDNWKKFTSLVPHGRRRTVAGYQCQTRCR